EADPTLINEPIREAIERPGAKQCQIHAIIAEGLASAEACWVGWRSGCMYRTSSGRLFVSCICGRGDSATCSQRPCDSKSWNKSTRVLRYPCQRSSLIANPHKTPACFGAGCLVRLPRIRCN